MLRARKLIALVCLAVLLAAALATNPHGLDVAWLAPYWLFLAILVCVAATPRDSDLRPLPFLLARIVASRAPPSA